MSESYKALLRDPRWQRKRLEVMQRAHFRCERCGNPNLTLNVHHQVYRSGAKPWEYADQELECICEACHQLEHGLIDHQAWLQAVNQSVPCPTFEELVRWIRAGVSAAQRKAARD